MNQLLGNDIAGVINSFKPDKYPILPVGNIIVTNELIRDSLIAYGADAFDYLEDEIRNEWRTFADTILTKNISLELSQYGMIWIHAAYNKEEEVADSIKMKYPNLRVTQYPSYFNKYTKYMMNNISYFSYKFMDRILVNDPESKMAYAFRLYRDNLPLDMEPMERTIYEIRHFDEHLLDKSQINLLNIRDLMNTLGNRPVTNIKELILELIRCNMRDHVYDLIRRNPDIKLSCEIII